MNKETFYKNKEIADEALLFAHQCYEENKAQFQGIEQSLALNLIAYFYLKEAHPAISLKFFSSIQKKEALLNKNNPLEIVRSYFIVIGDEPTESSVKALLNTFKSEAVACNPFDFLTIKANSLHNYLISNEHYNDHQNQTETTLSFEKKLGISNEIIEDVVKKNIGTLKFNSLFLNLKIGLDAKRYAEKLVRKSNTALEVNSKSTSINDIDSTITIQRERSTKITAPLSFIPTGDNKLTLSQSNDLHQFLRFWNEIDLCIASNHGNCEEKSDSAFSYVFKNHRHINAEVYYIQSTQEGLKKGSKGDHAIFVLGRAPNTPEHDIEKWNHDAIICDPWSHKVYFTKDHKKHLKNYVLLETKSKNYRTTCDINFTDYSLNKKPYADRAWMTHAVSLAKKEIEYDLTHATSDFDELQKDFKSLSPDAYLTYYSTFRDMQKIKKSLVEKERIFDYCSTQIYLALKKEIELFADHTKQLQEKLAKTLQKQFSEIDLDSLLHHLIRDNKTDLAKFFIKIDYDVDAQDDIGNTPLHEAVLAKNNEIIDALLAYDANLSLENGEGKMPHELAQPMDTVPLQEKLINHIAAQFPHIDSENLFHYFASHNRVEFLTFFLKIGLDVDLKNEKGNTLLHEAILGKNGEIVDLLLEHEADLSLTNAEGQTPLELAQLIKNKGPDSKLQHILTLLELAVIADDLSVYSFDQKPLPVKPYPSMWDQPNRKIPLNDRNMLPASSLAPNAG